MRHRKNSPSKFESAIATRAREQDLLSLGFGARAGARLVRYTVFL